MFWHVDPSTIASCLSNLLNGFIPVHLHLDKSTAHSSYFVTTYYKMISLPKNIDQDKKLRKPQNQLNKYIKCNGCRRRVWVYDCREHPYAHNTVFTCFL